MNYFKHSIATMALFTLLCNNLSAAEFRNLPVPIEPATSSHAVWNSKKDTTPAWTTFFASAGISLTLYAATLSDCRGGTNGNICFATWGGILTVVSLISTVTSGAIAIALHNSNYLEASGDEIGPSLIQVTYKGAYDADNYNWCFKPPSEPNLFGYTLYQTSQPTFNLVADEVGEYIVVLQKTDSPNDLSCYGDSWDQWVTINMLRANKNNSVALRETYLPINLNCELSNSPDPKTYKALICTATPGDPNQANSDLSVSWQLDGEPLESSSNVLNHNFHAPSLSHLQVTMTDEYGNTNTTELELDVLEEEL